MNTLKPGDTLLIREGIYQVKNKLGWLVKIQAFGSPSNPITVAAYTGERVIFEGDYYASQNIINMEVMYFVMRGIEMRYGSRGLRIINAQHSIFEDLYVHHTWDAAVTFNEKGGDYQNITLRHIRVAYTHGTGECFYLGCVGHTCTFYDSIVENNVCEYTCCTQGDGIEIKSGSYNNIIRNNVIHDTNYPGITTYETRGKAPNIIEGNIIWNTNENGIQTTEGAIIRNNIVINAGISGIAVQKGIVYPTRVTIEHNTVINSKFACLRINDLNIKAVGTPKHPITIKAADGEKVIIEGDKDASQNIINLSLYYASFKGFELRYGSIGLRLYECQHAVFEDLEVHHTAENAVSANQLGAEYVDVTFRNVRVHHTGGFAGECFYLGCNYGQCIMRDSFIENYYCAYTCCGQGDGIELKQGSYNNIIRNNVVHDTNYPGITLYSSDEELAPNIVEGNIIWNTNENGLQVTGGAIIRNNIVMNAKLSGIAVQVNQGKIRDLSIVHNTVVNAGFACLGTFNTNTGKQIIISGNALYCENGVAIYENQPNPSTKYGVNVVRGTSSAPYTIQGKGLTEDFENVTAVPYNLYPKKNGALYNIANTTLFDVVDTDFNGKQRSNQRMDVGAYQYITGYDSNPGWVPSDSPRPLDSAPPKKSSIYVPAKHSNAPTTVPMLFILLLSYCFIIF